MNKALNIKKKSVAIRLICGVGVTLVLASCEKEERHNTPRPDRGAVTVSLTGLAADEAYVLDIDGQTADITGSSFTFPDLLTPGTYSLVVYNRAEGFTFDGRMAQVHTADGKTRADGVSIIPLPGYLKTASREITVVADDTLHLTPAPQQRVRDLHIEFTVTQGRPELIQTVTGTLSGIAGAFDMEAEQTTGEPASTVVASPATATSSPPMPGCWVRWEPFSRWCWTSPSRTADAPPGRTLTRQRPLPLSTRT